VTVTAPSTEVLKAFGVLDRPVRLPGGERRCWVSSDVVFKPCDDQNEWVWLGETLPLLRPARLRLSRPIRALDGRWVVGGWTAQQRLEGTEAPQWLDILDVADRFATATSRLSRPTFIDRRTHPWSVGDRVACGEVDPPDRDPGGRLLRRLLAVRRPVRLQSQLIHGDLTENVLFADGLDPAVIDVTPYWRPPGFASAIVVEDAVRWHDADPAPLIEACANVNDFPQLLIRAVIFRLVTSMLFGFDGDDPSDFDVIADVAIPLAERDTTG